MAVSQDDRLNDLERHERLATLEQKVSDLSQAHYGHIRTCGTRWAAIESKLDSIYAELNNRLPRWATVGGIVTFSLLTGVVGWLAKAVTG